MTDSFWDFHNKTEMECSAAEIILKAAEFDVSRLHRPKKHPPDCEGMLDGLWSAVELTRLTHQGARTQTQKARKERRAGRKPKTFEAYYEWDREDLLRKNSFLSRLTTSQTS